MRKAILLCCFSTASFVGIVWYSFWWIVYEAVIWAKPLSDVFDFSKPWHLCNSIGLLGSLIIFAACSALFFKDSKKELRTSPQPVNPDSDLVPIVVYVPKMLFEQIQPSAPAPEPAEKEKPAKRRLIWREGEKLER